MSMLLQTPKVATRQEKVLGLRAEQSGSSGVEMTRHSPSLKVVVDSGDLIVGLFCQITVREDIATAVIKKCVRVNIARARGVIRLRVLWPQWAC